MPQHDPSSQHSQDAHPSKQKPINKKEDDGFPTYQLTILAICRFSEPIAFSSILAYTYVMVQDLNGTDTNASFYAGLLVSAYAVAEAMTAMIWGAVSDRYGRKPVVLFGLVGVAISSLLFGLAKSYWVALLARFVGGSLNGNVSVMQTMVAEMVKRPEHEPRAYAVQPFVWFLGAIVGSAMGGFLAQPAKFYPDFFSEDGLFGRYPYLLPNLVAVAVIVIAVVQGIFFLEETNPRFTTTATTTARDSRTLSSLFSSSSATLGGGVEEQGDETAPLLHNAGHTTKSITESMRQDGPFFEEEGLPIATNQRFDLRHNSFGTIHSITVRPDPHDLQNARRQQQQQQQETMATRPSSSSSSFPPLSPQKGHKGAFNFAVVMLIISLVIAAFHQMAFAAIFPIYLLDPPSYSNASQTILHATSLSRPHLDLAGGMGFTLHDVGGYLAANGFIALFCQGIIFPIFVEKMGVWLSFLLPTLVYPICYLIMPFLSLLRSEHADPADSWALPAGIYTSLFLPNLLGIIMTPCALILLKNATPSPLVLGRVNGLAMSAVCAARTVSSPLVGVVYDFGGSSAAWGCCAFIALLGAVQLWWVPREVDGVAQGDAEVHVENVLIGHASVEDGNAIYDENEAEEVTSNHH